MSDFIILPCNSDMALRVDQIDAVEQCTIREIVGIDTNFLSCIRPKYEDESGTRFIMKSGNKIEVKIKYEEVMSILGHPPKLGYQR